jgi:hypothetical protein
MIRVLLQRRRISRRLFDLVISPSRNNVNGSLIVGRSPKTELLLFHPAAAPENPPSGAFTGDAAVIIHFHRRIPGFGGVCGMTSPFA